MLRSILYTRDRKVYLTTISSVHVQMHGLGSHWHVQQHFPFGQQLPIELAVSLSGAIIMVLTATWPGFRLFTIFCSLGDNGILTTDGAAGADFITARCCPWDSKPVVMPQKASSTAKAMSKYDILILLCLLNIF